MGSDYTVKLFGRKLLFDDVLKVFNAHPDKFFRERSIDGGFIFRVVYDNNECHGTLLCTDEGFADITVRHIGDLSLHLLMEQCYRDGLVLSSDIVITEVSYGDICRSYLCPKCLYDRGDKPPENLRFLSNSTEDNDCTMVGRYVVRSLSEESLDIIAKDAALAFCLDNGFCPGCLQCVNPAIQKAKLLANDRDTGDL